MSEPDLEEHASISHLTLWTEIVGTFHSIYFTDAYICLEVGKSLFRFPKESNEAQCIEEILDSKLIDEKIGILRTDDPIRPLRIRIEQAPS